MNSTSSPNGAVRADFTNWCRENFYLPETIAATNILEDGLDAYLAKIFLEIDLFGYLDTPKTVTEIISHYKFDNSSEVAVLATLRRMADSRKLLLMDDMGDKSTFTTLLTPDDPTSEIDELHDRMAALGEQFLVPMEFLRFGAEKFIYSLRDDPHFMDHVLTGRERDYYQIWERATNTDPLQDIHGKMGAEALRNVFAGGSILEVGGGTGNGVRNILECLDSHDEIDKIKNYIFTDISMQFIMNTRKSIQGDYPKLTSEWRFLDINRAFNEQKISENSQDLIYGVNAAHIAKNTVEFLRQCKATLKPGGLVVFSERIRRSAFDMAPREIVLNLSEYHRSAAEKNSDYRPVHAYLSADNWLRALELAGFKDAEVWPDLHELSTEFPNQYAAVFIAKA